MSVNFTIYSDAEYEEAHDLPGQFYNTDEFKAADLHTRHLMATFPPWRFFEYTNPSHVSNLPVRVLMCSETDTLICVSVHEGRLDIRTNIPPSDVAHVPMWTDDHLEKIAQLDWQYQTIFLLREGFGLASEILAALFEADETETVDASVMEVEGVPDSEAETETLA